MRGTLGPQADNSEGVERVEQPRARSRAVVPATLVLVATVAALSGASLFALDRISASNGTVAASSRVLASYQSLQHAIATEAFAEAGYRRAPAAATRARLLSSFTAVDTAAAGVRAAGATTDRAAAAYLLVLNRRYADEVRDAVEAGGSAATTTRDDRVAGPALDAMQALVDAAVSRTSAESQAAVAHQRKLTGQLRWLVPVVLSAVVGALALAWALVLSQHRKATARAAASELLALHDPLTGVGNRRAFERALAPELSREEPDAAVVLLDLDGFKQINDTYGHDVGDVVLREVAQRLQAAVRPSDVVARLGGDEFALLLRPAAGAAHVLDRLPATVSAQLVCGTAVLHPRVSMGSAPVPPGATQEVVLRAADRQLYESKRGRDRVVTGKDPVAG